MDKEPKLKIGFELTDKFGNHYKSESTAEVFESPGENDLDFIGEQLNVFLKQCGYARKNNYILWKMLPKMSILLLMNIYQK